MTPSELDKIAAFEMWDKAEHFIAFGAGAVNLALALCWSTAWSWKRLAVFAIIAISVFGAVDEIHQLFTDKRSGADVFDWTADTLGALTGALLTVLVYARYFSTPRPSPTGA